MRDFKKNNSANCIPNSVPYGKGCQWDFVAVVALELCVLLYISVFGLH